MPQKQSAEAKVEILREYLKGRISQSEAVRKGGLSKDMDYTQ